MPCCRVVPIGLRGDSFDLSTFSFVPNTQSCMQHNSNKHPSFSTCGVRKLRCFLLGLAPVAPQRCKRAEYFFRGCCGVLAKVPHKARKRLNSVVILSIELPHEPLCLLREQGQPEPGEVVQLGRATNRWHRQGLGRTLVLVATRGCACEASAGRCSTRSSSRV